MADLERLPLSEEEQEEIELQWHEIDKKYWVKLRILTVTQISELTRVLDPAAEPPAPPRPVHLRHLLESYARELFDAEANRYEVHNREFENWITKLSARVALRLEQTIKPLNLDYHASEIERRKAIYEALRKRGNERLGSRYELSPTPDSPATSVNLPKHVFGNIQSVPEILKVEAGPKAERNAFRDRYFSDFAEKILILDVCWASRQRYREWTRWINGQLKDGSKADRAFRAVLTSGKRPEQYRSEPRPKGWK